MKTLSKRLEKRLPVSLCLETGILSGCSGAAGLGARGGNSRGLVGGGEPPRQAENSSQELVSCLNEPNSQTY
eukprot:3902083-Pyramimonas_sp.AAC.1